MALLEGITAVILLIVFIYLFYRFYWAADAVPNPFPVDCVRPQQPMVTDEHKRARVLKQGFAVRKIPQDLDAIVIGSGLGGLSTAVIMAKLGKRVLVLEQHDQAGGCCHTFIEKGFEFDVGIHYVGEMRHTDLPRVVMDQLTEGQVQWDDLGDLADVVVIGKPGKQKIYPLKAGSYDIWKKSLIEIFPDEEKVINKFVDLTQKASESTFDQLLLKFLPKWLLRVLFKTGLIHRITSFFKLAATSPMEVLDELTDNDSLKTLLTYNFLAYGCLPSQGSFAIHTAALNHYVRGAFYPRGGPSEFPFQMIQIIERSGGKVLVRAPVTEILAENDRVVGVKVQKGIQGDEIEIRAPIIISDAGMVNTFKKLLPKELADKSSIPRMIGKQVSSGTAYITIFVGLNGTDEELKLTKSNYWAITRNDINKYMQEYLALSVEEAAEREVPSLFIAFSSAKDSTYQSRCPGKSVCVAFGLANWEWFAPWQEERVKKRGFDYDALKDRFGERIWQQTCCLFPHLADKVEYFDVGTPITHSYYTGWPEGGMYGLEHSKSRYGSPEAVMNLRSDSGIPGLVLTGQDILVAGCMCSMVSGVMGASHALGRNIVNDVMAVVKQREKQK